MHKIKKRKIKTKITTKKNKIKSKIKERNHMSALGHGTTRTLQ